LQIYFADTAINLFYLYHEVGARYFLTSFWYNKKIGPYKKFKETHPDGTIMLDSGAFTALMRNETIDIEAYAKFCNEVKEWITYFVNLDVIGDGEASKVNYDYLRDQGIESLPVYHIGEDIKYLKYYLSRSNHIGLGGLVPYARDQRKLENFLTRTLELIPKDKQVHMFGITTPSILMRFSDRIHSADSVAATDITGNQNRGYSFSGLPKGLKTIFNTPRLTPEQRDWLNKYNAYIFVKLEKQINDYLVTKQIG